MQWRMQVKSENMQKATTLLLWLLIVNACAASVNGQTDPRKSKCAFSYTITCKCKMFFLDRVANYKIHGAHAVQILTSNTRTQNVCGFVTNVPVTIRSAVVQMHENTHAQNAHTI